MKQTEPHSRSVIKRVDDRISLGHNKNQSSFIKPKKVSQISRDQSLDEMKNYEDFINYTEANDPTPI